MDNSYDQAALDSFINSVFCAKSYEASASIALDYSNATAGACSALLKLPDGFSRQAVDRWVDELPDNSTPAYLGLPSTAENQLQSYKGISLLGNLGTLLESELTTEMTNSNANVVTIETNKTSDDRSHLAYLAETIVMWKNSLPADDVVKRLAATDLYLGSDSTASPIQRAIYREIGQGSSLLQLVYSDIQIVYSYCVDSAVKTTNRSRVLLASFRKGAVPTHWKAEMMAANSSLNTFISDLSARSKALDEYLSGGNVEISSSTQFWLGGTFYPEAFITATRQHTAQSNGWSLEELELFLDINISDVADASSGCDVVLRGLTLENASWREGSLLFDSELRNRLQPSRLRWRRHQDVLSEIERSVCVPVYLTESRKILVSEVRLVMVAEVPPHALAQRGVAIILSG